MDIYDYFNSPDVAEHCRNIGHKFNAFESAVIVSESQFRTLAEKHAAYRDIIAEYPDMEIPAEARYGHIKSFCQTLKNILKYEEKLLKKYLKLEVGAAYQAIVHDHNYYSYSRYYPDDRGVFATHEKALAEALETAKRIAADYGNSNINEINTYIEIKKIYLENQQEINAVIALSGDIISMRDSHKYKEYAPYGDLDILHKCIYVPTPFKRGDLVEMVFEGGHIGNVCVLLELVYENPERYEEYLRTGDFFIMTSDIYSMLDNGDVGIDDTHGYEDLRYCRRELKGEERMLKYISLYIQKKISFCELLRVQKCIVAEKIIENVWGGSSLLSILEGNNNDNK